MKIKSITWKILIPFLVLILFSITLSSVLSQMMLSKTSGYMVGLLENQLDQQKKVVERVTNNKVDDTKKMAVLLAEQIANHPDILKAIEENNPALIHSSLKSSIEMAKQKANIDLVWVTRLTDRTSDKRTPIFACPTNPSFDGFDKLNYASTNDALEKGETVASFEVNEEDGKLQVSAPVKDHGQIIGAVVVGQQTYQGFVKASDTGSTLFLTANQKDFYVMTDSNTDEVGKAIFKDSHENLKEKAKNVNDLAKGTPLYSQILPL